MTFRDSSSRFLLLPLLVALSGVLLGGRCGGYDAVPDEVWRKDVAPAFDYGLYSDVSGRLVGETSGVLLVHRSEHLERVYADALNGNARARVLFHQLEEVAEASGVGLADKALSLGCSALPTCTVRWGELGELIPSQGPGGLRLKQLLARGFEKQARLEHVENAVITAALDALLVGGTVASAEGRAAEGEARAQAAETRKLSQEALAERGLLPDVEGALPLEDAEALEVRLQEAEALETGPRQSPKLEVLARQRPSLQKPPLGVAADSKRWAEYVAYWERRYEELAGTRKRPAWLPPAKPPLEWTSYGSFLERVQSAVEFQRSAARKLLLETRLPEGERTWLKGMTQPVMEENVGLRQERGPALFYVDQLVVDEASLKPGAKPIVHSFSNKQRNFKVMAPKDVKECLSTDVQEALTKYGGVVEIRRSGHVLFGQKVAIFKVHLVYDATLMSDETRTFLQRNARQAGVEIHFHVQ